MSQRNGTGRFLGVDIGGTFTDLVWHDPESGTVLLGKGPTNPEDASAGVLDVVTGSLPGHALGETSHFIHATTTGLNAVLERKGATVGLLVTAGFRDVLEIRRGDRAAMYDVLWRPSEPLVPRSLRLGVRERVRADGEIVTPLEAADVKEALVTFRSAGVECVAITFINAYVNPEHETRARELLLEAGFQGEIALSHQVSGEYREFERTATTVVDAYVRPAMADYLGRLEEGLRAKGFLGEDVRQPIGRRRPRAPRRSLSARGDAHLRSGRRCRRRRQARSVAGARRRNRGRCRRHELRHRLASLRRGSTPA